MERGCVHFHGEIGVFHPGDEQCDETQMSRMQDDEAVIDEWIKGGKDAFVFYREPGESVCHGIRAARYSLQSFEGIPPLDGKTGFVFAPFRFGEGHPLWLLPLEEEIEAGISRAACPDEVEAPAPMPFCGRLEEQPSKEYREAFRFFSAALRAGDFQKLVLSRACTDAFPRGFSWARAFGAACRRYVHSYVYLFHTPQTGFWLGATPEILLAGRKRGLTVQLGFGRYAIPERGQVGRSVVGKEHPRTSFCDGIYRRLLAGTGYPVHCGRALYGYGRRIGPFENRYPFPSFFGRSLRRLVAGFASYACRMRVAQRRGFSLHPVA